MKGLILSCLLFLQSPVDWKPAALGEIYGEWVATSLISDGRVYLEFSRENSLFTETVVNEKHCKLITTSVAFFRYKGNGCIDRYAFWDGKIWIDQYRITKSPDSKQIHISSVPSSAISKDVPVMTVVDFERVTNN